MPQYVHVFNLLKTIMFLLIINIERNPSEKSIYKKGLFTFFNHLKRSQHRSCGEVLYLCGLKIRLSLMLQTREQVARVFLQRSYLFHNLGSGAFLLFCFFAFLLF